ncbi:MAG: hypothetical protein ACLRQQ_05790, partial [Acutalibacteraceae bacterium]
GDGIRPALSPQAPPEGFGAMLGLRSGWEIGRRLGGLRLSFFSFFLKEDTKRHRKTLWKSGSITIATKKNTAAFAG